jgi:hypothetical protein
MQQSMQGCRFPAARVPAAASHWRKPTACLHCLPRLCLPACAGLPVPLPACACLCLPVPACACLPVAPLWLTAWLPMPPCRPALLRVWTFMLLNVLLGAARPHHYCTRIAQQHGPQMLPATTYRFGSVSMDTLPEWSKGVDSSSTSASCVGSNPTGVIQQHSRNLGRFMEGSAAPSRGHASSSYRRFAVCLC